MVETKVLILICSGAILGFAVSLYLLRRYKPSLRFHSADLDYALNAIRDLGARLQAIPHITDEQLQEHFEAGNILMAKHPDRDSSPEKESNGVETMQFLNGPANTRYWPYYHYTFPYQYTEGGAWPPNMSSRLYNWQPGFATSGWSYWMRPGMSYARWPRNRWVRNNTSYYFINNGKDRSKDYI